MIRPSAGDKFFEDPEIAFLSIHRYGQGFYPGTGAANETGTSKGAGRIFNEPIRFGTSRQDYLTRFSSVLEKAATLVKPELVLISAGFDAHAKDPIGALGLEVEDFVEMTKRVLVVARTHARGRVVSCLEGGYNLEILPLAVQTHLEEFGKPTGRPTGRERKVAAERRPVSCHSAAEPQLKPIRDPMREVRDQHREVRCARILTPDSWVARIGWDAQLVPECATSIEK